MPRATTRPQPAGKPGLRLWLLPAAAVALTFAVRLWLILDLRGHPYAAISPYIVDSYYYHRWALEILGGNFWGTDVFFLRPLLPYLLALVYALFGKGLVTVLVLQAVLAAASCLLLYDSARRMFNRTAAAISAFGFALTGVLVFYTATLLYVELTVFFCLLTVWLVLVSGDRPWRWILAGLSFGVMVICRPELLLALPAFLIILWRSRTRLRNLGVMLAGTIAVLAVTPIRNAIFAHEPVLFTAHSGVNFYFGNNPSADGTWQPAEELGGMPGFSHGQLKHLAKTVDGEETSWSRASSHWLGKGFAYLAGNPARALELLVRKFLLFWANYEVPNNYYPETVDSTPLRLGLVNFALAAAFGAVGMFLGWPQRRRSWPAYVMTAGFIVSSLAFYVLSRLRAPVIPFLLILAGYGLYQLVKSLRERMFRQAGIAVLVGAAVFAVSLVIPADRPAYSSQAWTQIGNIRLNGKQVQPALDAFRRGIAANPDNPSTRYSLILALCGMGKIRDAVAEYRKLATITGAGLQGQLLMSLAAARIAIARRDFPHAARLYSSVIEQDPANAENHYLLGLVYVSMDSLSEARLSLQQAVTLDPGHQSALEALRAVESKLGRGE